MKKAKKIAKRLRARAAELHQLVRADGTHNAWTERALLMVDVLNEVADQISPRNKVVPIPVHETKVRDRTLDWEKGKDFPSAKAAD